MVGHNLQKKERWNKKELNMGSGCGPVGRAVAFNTSGLRFDSSHRQNLYRTFVCLLVYYQLYRKDKNK